jgi:hypothetical protein
LFENRDKIAKKKKEFWGQLRAKSKKFKNQGSR